MVHQTPSAEAAQRDYYEVLGVARDADAKAIKDAFRTLALQYHPDRNKAPDAEARFKEIAEAYAILSDPKKRADYDARGFAGVADLSREDLFGGINFEDIFGGLNFDLGGFSPFEGFFHRRRAGPAQGAHIEVVLPVSLERVASGGEEEIRLMRPATCAACHGTGEKDGAPAPRCTACEGSGRVTHSRRDAQAQVLIQQVSVCPTCQGQGYTHTHPCPSCQGAGNVEQEEVLRVLVPVGAHDGLALRIPGKGMPGPESGSPPGDLLAVVQTRPDPRFERVGSDLLRHEILELTDAVLGTTLTVPTLEGSASVSVPPGTQPDALLRLKTKGLPPLNGGPRGDLYLRMGVRLPGHLTREERALFEQLRELQKGRVTSP